MSDGPAPLYDDIADAPPGGVARWCRAGDGTRLRLAFWPLGGARGTVFVFPGRTEYVEKYGRVIARLHDLGFAALVVDWRGQGLSDRPAGAPDSGDVESFALYQQDVAAALKLADEAGLPAPFHLLAHSMGGCIGLRSLLAGCPFASAVFSAPMWGLRTDTILRAGLASAAARLRAGPSGAQANVVARDGSGRFEDNVLTTDAAMFDWHRAQIAARPALWLGPPGIRWSRAALREMGTLWFRSGPDCPVLIGLGGDESVVSPVAIRQRLRRMPAARLIDFPGARHELFLESEPVRARFWDAIAAHFDDHAQARR